MILFCKNFTNIFRWLKPILRPMFRSNSNQSIDLSCTTNHLTGFNLTGIFVLNSLTARLTFPFKNFSAKKYHKSRFQQQQNGNIEWKKEMRGITVSFAAQLSINHEMNKSTLTYVLIYLDQIQFQAPMHYKY